MFRLFYVRNTTDDQRGKDSHWIRKNQMKRADSTVSFNSRKQLSLKAASSYRRQRRAFFKVVQLILPLPVGNFNISLRIHNQHKK